MKLEEVGKLSIGATLARIKAKPNEKAYPRRLFTIQELNKVTVDPNLQVEGQEVLVSDRYIREVPLAKVGMVLIGLTAPRAFVVTDAYEGYVIPINFVYLECHEGVCPEYVAWYFNEHPDIQRRLAVERQGSSLQALSMQKIRELPIDLPGVATQKKIATVYRLGHQRKKLWIEKQRLEEKLMNEWMIRTLKEEK